MSGGYSVIGGRRSPQAFRGRNHREAPASQPIRLRSPEVPFQRTPGAAELWWLAFGFRPSLHSCISGKNPSRPTFRLTPCVSVTYGNPDVPGFIHIIHRLHKASQRREFRTFDHLCIDAPIAPLFPRVEKIQRARGEVTGAHTFGGGQGPGGGNCGPERKGTKAARIWLAGMPSAPIAKAILTAGLR